MYISDRLTREAGRDYAKRIIKDNIIRLELKPGSMVSEKEIANELNLSRTPVREALFELSKSQIVEIYPQKGSMVSFIDYSLVEEAYFMRLIMEKAIVELTCTMAKPDDFMLIEENLMLQELYLKNSLQFRFKLLELDNEFHKQLFCICNKMQSYYMVNSMSVHFDRIRSISLKTVKDLKVVSEHRAIADAIKAGDAKLAKQIMVKHLSHYKIEEEVVRKEYPNYFK
jgi:DNA-binding GntR family transcriptional regulator